jgi:hypothetical protein
MDTDSILPVSEHVEDLALAVANVIGRVDRTTMLLHNTQAISTFDGAGVAKTAKVTGKGCKIIHFNPNGFEFPEGKKKKVG